MTNIFLQDARVSLVTYKYSEDETARRPAVAIHADLSAFDYKKVDNGDDYLSIMAFPISKIKPVSSEINNPMVRVSFEASFGKISFHIPLQFLTVSAKLSKFDNGFGLVPMMLIDSSTYPKVNPAEVIDVTDMAFMVYMPSPDTPEGEDVAETLSAIYHHSLNEPAAAVNWDEIEEEAEDLDPAVEFALSRLLNSSLSFSRGDTAPMFTIPEMLSDEWEGPVIPPAFHLSAIYQIATLVHSMAPHQRSAYNKDSEGVTVPSLSANIEFLRMLQESGLESKFEKIVDSAQLVSETQDENYQVWRKDVELWDTPACESWTKEMEPLRSYLEHANLLEDIEDLIDWGFDEQGAFQEKVDVYGLETVLLAAYAFFAQYAHKFHKVIDSNQPLFTPQSVVISWVGSSPNVRWWELESVADELASFNTANAADIAVYGSIHYEDKIILPYLAPIIVEIGAFLLEDDSFASLSPEDLVEELSKLSFKGQEYNEFESFILRYFRKIHEVLDDEDLDLDEASAQSIAAHALQHLINPGVDFHNLARVFLWAFPVLSELKANAEMEPFTEEWEEFRYAQLRSMVSEVSSNIPRRIYAQN